MEDNKKMGGDTPIPCDLAEGKKYAWCACGHSENQPFCDGSHIEANSVSNLRFEATQQIRFGFVAAKRPKTHPSVTGLITVSGFVRYFQTDFERLYV